jgi:hypothetical protein
MLTLTDADYRATEELLLEADELSGRAREAADREGLSEAEANALRALAGEIQSLARGYGDAGRFYDGNFGPPSAEEIARMGELEAELARLLGG